MAFLVSSVPYSFSCDANGIEGIDESGGSSCSSFEVTLSSTPTLTTNGTTTTYPAGTVSGFYLTNPGDSLTTNVQGVVTQYSQGATFSVSVGYYAPSSSNANPNPFSDSAAPGNSIFSYSGSSGFYQNMSFNMGSSMAGNFYLGGQATLNTCRGNVWPMGYVAFLEHVTAKPTITSITTYPTTAMTTSGPLIVGQPGAVVLNGTNLGESGTVTFTLVGGGQSFQGTFSGYNSTQAVIQSVVAPVAGTYNVVDQETTDASGFSFAEAGAAGQDPKSSGAPQVTAQGLTVSQAADQPWSSLFPTGDTVLLSAADSSQYMTITLNPSQTLIASVSVAGVNVDSGYSQPLPGSACNGATPSLTLQTSGVTPNSSYYANIPVTVSSVSPAGCGGVLDVQLAANPGGPSSNFTRVVIPPEDQVKQMLGSAIAYAQIPSLDPSQVAQTSVSIAAKNRFGNSAFSCNGTVPASWKDLANCGSNNIETYNGSYRPMVTVQNAANVFLGLVPGTFVGGATCYWSPTNGQFASVQSVFNQGAQPFDITTIGGPTCFSPQFYPTDPQILWKTSEPYSTLPNNNAAPAFLFVRLRPSSEGGPFHHSVSVR